MNRKTISALLMSLSLLVASPAIAAQQNTAKPPQKTEQQIIVPKVTKYSQAEFVKLKGVPAAIKKIHDVFPETKSYTLDDHPFTNTFPISSGKIIVQRSYYCGRLVSTDGKKAVGFNVDANTGELREVAQSITETKNPLINLTNEQVKEIGMPYLNNLYGDQLKAYQIQTIRKNRIDAGPFGSFHIYTISLMNPKDEKAPLIHLNLKGDVLTNINYR